MSTHPYIDRICCVVIALVLVVTVVFLNGEDLGIQAAARVQGYESRLFDTQSVHTIDIVMEDWDGFLETCTDEEYVLCSVVIDGEPYSDVAIRAKGNTSLMQVASYGNDRYSFKIEFDHYDSTKSYHGLDKLSLNNIIQDNTYMKDYLSYQMMGFFGVDAPLCSFVYITVNGEDWGLYLAVEGVEEAFLERNYGSGYGELYKPDSQSMGGGRGNGGRFNMEDWEIPEEFLTGAFGAENTALDFQTKDPEQRSSMMDFQEEADLGERPAISERASREDTKLPEAAGNRDGFGGMMGSSDVSLIYTDDDPESYPNIFDNAKTDITQADQARLIASLKQLNEGENIEQVVNVDEVIRYFVVHNFVCNFDSYTGSMIHNYYLYEEDGQMYMIPWDYNLAFGGFMGSSDATALVNYPIDTPVSGGTVDSRPMLAWIFASEEYTQLYHEYFATFLSDYFESGYFLEMMDQVQEMISPYVQKDPTRFCTYEEFETGIQTLREFCQLRAESIRGQLEGEIPSTSDGQTQNRESLVDASAINISDMGTMNNSMRGGMRGPGNSGEAGFPGGLPSDDIPDPATGGTVMEPESGDEESSSGFTAPPDSGDGTFPEGMTPPEGVQDSFTPPDSGDGTFPEGMTPPGGAQGSFTPPGFPSSDGWQEGDVPSGNLGTGVVQTDGSSWTLLGICAAGLALGIIVAVCYKKRG